MLKAKFCWKELDNNGSLKEPTVGPSYEYLNICYGFDTEYDAIERLNKMIERYGSDIPYQLVLVKIYSR